MSKMSSEEKTPGRKTLRTLSAKSLEQVVGGITPSIPIPPP